MITTTKITPLDYQKLTINARQLHMRGEKPYILLTPDNMIIKHIYRRGFWSSSTIWPYPFRFKKNCERLKKLGYIVPEVQKIYFFPEKNCHLVLYPFIAGKTIAARSTEEDSDAFARLPAFIAKLHQQGIFFRDLHIQNFIELPNKQFALIDVASVKIYKKPLSQKQRARNLKSFFEHKRNHGLLDQFGKDNFLKKYSLAATLSPK